MTIIDLFHKETEMLSVSQQIKKKCYQNIRGREKESLYPKELFPMQEIKGKQMFSK